MTLPGCLILAAGSARRFGTQKLLHPMADGRPLIQHTLDAVTATGLETALVYRPDDQALLEAIAGYTNLKLIPCPDHNKGLGHSIASGVSAVPDWNGWMICLADMPAISTDTYSALAKALDSHPIVIPEYEHKFGHPRGFERSFYEDLANLQGDVGARDLLLQHRNETCVLTVNDPGILLDIDYPADLNTLDAQPSQSTTGQTDSMQENDVTTADTEVQTESPAPTVAVEKPEANDQAEPLPELAAEPEADTGTAVEVNTAPETTPETPAAPPPPRVRFKELNLDPRLQQAIDDLGFEFATPIQSLALPHSLQGKDVIGKAQTGTGKTAAFLITVINRLLNEPEQEERYNGEPRALILAPTRELAMQIEKDAVDLIKHTPLTLMSIVGGMDYQKQQRRLQNEIIDIVVGTPGRLIDFTRSKDLFLSETEILVIDEADRMLDMGFIPDVKRLIRETPFKEYRQTLLFSATFTQDIMNLSGSWTRNAEHLEVESDNVAADTVDQKVYIVTTEEKFTLLYNLINQQHLERVMIFANRRDETRDLTHKLRDYDIKCAMLSGDVPQQKRIRTLEDFRSGRIRVLIATDVAGRGIHIDDITFVVNYTLPEDPEDYVHRIGRTGRAGKSGTSISFACEEDAFQLPAIEKLLGAKLECSQPEPELLAEVPPPAISPEKAKERDSHTHRRRRPRRQGGNRR